MGGGSSLIIKSEEIASIRFINFKFFKKLKHFPTYLEQKDLETKFEKLSPTIYDKSFIVFISHTWLRTWIGSEGWDGIFRPDNVNNMQFKLCCEGIQLLIDKCAPGIEHCYVWIDYGCIDQNANLSEQLKALPFIIQLSDCIFTPIYDPYPHLFTLPKVSSQMRDEYKSLGWDGTPYSYLNRAWCRWEMAAGAVLPLLDSEKRMKNFAGSLFEHKREGRRAHVLYGSYEQHQHTFPTFLPRFELKDFQRFSPREGHLTHETDRIHIQNLTESILPYLDRRHVQPGYQGEYGLLGLREGQGKYRYANGDEYEGEWFYGYYDGTGTLTLANGDSYTGTWVNGKKEGTGRYHWKDVDECYVGQWHNDLQHGQGQYQFTDGSVYTGDYHNGILEGRGIYTYPSGLIYEGAFIAGKKHGKGKMTYPFGHIYEGQWREDVMEGDGMFSADGDVYMGQFKENVKHGIGKLIHVNGNVYEGQFEWDKQTGLGIFTMSNGDVYEGQVRNGMFDGTGKFTTIDGEVYDGEWKEDEKHGQGQWQGKDGMIRTGQWEQGQYSPTPLS